MLADNRHMPEWFNECQAASGIGDAARYRRRNVDLVCWRAADSRLSLVELKWNSDIPSKAVRQILRYGAAYLFCRNHWDRLPVAEQPAMSATHVALLVAAPGRYYANDGLLDCLSRARQSLRSIGDEPGTRGLSMSLDALAFPEWFDRLPFGNGTEVHDSCDRPELTETGREIIEVFDGLTSVYPDREGAQGCAADFCQACPERRSSRFSTLLPATRSGPASLIAWNPLRRWPSVRSVSFFAERPTFLRYPDARGKSGRRARCLSRPGFGFP